MPGQHWSPGVRGAVTAREAADPLLLVLAGSSRQSGPADLLHRSAGVGRKGGAQRLASCCWDALVCHHPPMISVLGLVPWSCTGLKMQPSLPVLLSLLVQDICSRCCSIWESCLRPGCPVKSQALPDACLVAVPWPQGERAEGSTISHFLDRSRPYRKSLQLSVVWGLFLFEDCHVD